MKKLIIYILSNLLHRANREHYCSPEFYAIKNRLLLKFGKHTGYDVQFIEGKKCHTCNGTGIYIGYYGRQYNDTCYHCYNGWYKRPTWNILERVQFGKYTFHKPYQRAYKKPDILIGAQIEGYISHQRAKYGALCTSILFLLFEKGYIKRWYKGAGIGWRVYWWLPKAYLNNIIHIIKKGKNAYPVKKLTGKIYRLTHTKKQLQELEDLPF